MFDEYVKEPKSLDTLTLEQVSERIHSTNEKTTRRWLEACGVKVYRFARKSFVYQVEVESEIDKLQRCSQRFSSIQSVGIKN